MRELWVAELGLRPYAEVLELQRAAAVARIAGRLSHDLLLLVEHPPVVTLGRGARDASHLIAPESLLAKRGVELFEVERGGDVTFHGPGQLVGYPIVDLAQHRQDLHWYLRQLELTLIDALATLGVAGQQRQGLTGVWSSARKIASIGVHSRQWVTWHGFALNVTTDLSFFDLMVPCGITDVTMTSVAAELATAGGDPAAFEPAALGARARHAVTASFAQVFGLSAVNVAAGDLALHEEAATAD